MQRQELQQIVDGNLIHVEQSVQEAAGACLRNFLGGYGTAADAALVTGYCKGLFDKDSEFVRSGSGIALAAMPRCMVAPVWQDTLQSLCRACNVDTAVQARDGDARVRAITVRPCQCMVTNLPACTRRLRRLGCVTLAEQTDECAGAHNPSRHCVSRRRWGDEAVGRACTWRNQHAQRASRSPRAADWQQRG